VEWVRGRAREKEGDDILDRRDHDDSNLNKGKDSSRVAFCCFKAKATTCPYPMPNSSPYPSSPSLSSYGIGPLPRQRAIPINPSHCWRALSPVLSFSSLTLSLTAIVAASRIYLKYRTPTQVTVRCRAGTVSAVVWFGVTE